MMSSTRRPLLASYGSVGGNRNSFDVYFGGVDVPILLGRSSRVLNDAP
jgi:hypothetical protein